jgi:hypothetical protein
VIVEADLQAVVNYCTVAKALSLFSLCPGPADVTGRSTKGRPMRQAVDGT